MAKRQGPFRRYRLVYRRSSLLTKCVVLATLIVTTAVLLGLTVGIRNARRAEAESRAQAAQLERENAALEENIQQADSVESHKQIAEQELGLVDPNTVIFIPEN